MPVTSSQRPEPCRDWHEWADIPDQHPDFSYWRWDDGGLSGIRATTW